MKHALARVLVIGIMAFVSLLSLVQPQKAASAQISQMQAGRQVFAANCAVCHGANGQGDIGPNLQQIASHRSFDETVAFIEHPVGAMPKLYPGRLSQKQVLDVVTYIRQGLRPGASSGSANAQPNRQGGPGGYGPGMMYRNGAMGPGMTGGNGMMGGYGSQANRTALNLSVDDVKRYFHQWLATEGNPRVKLGRVEVKNADTIVAEIVTADKGSLVVRYVVNRHTGYITPE